VQGGERFGRYSIIGLAARPASWSMAQVLVLTGNRIAERETTPIRSTSSASSCSASAPPASGLPRFCGGLVGCFGYDTVRYVETRLTRTHKPDEIGTPDIGCCCPKNRRRRQPLRQADPDRLCRARLPGAYQKARARLKELLGKLRSRSRCRPNSRCIPSRRCPLRRGRLQAGGAQGQGLHHRRRHHAGRAVAAHEQALPGQPAGAVPGAAQPEPVALHVLFRLRGLPGRRRLAGDPGAPRRRARHRAPIAGTRKRGASPEEDAALAAELLADEKERAEHTQLLDLGRNDCGRVARIGPSSSPRT
jgi:anthranilate synthase component 1